MSAGIEPVKLLIDKYLCGTDRQNETMHTKQQCSVQILQQRQFADVGRNRARQLIFVQVSAKRVQHAAINSVVIITGSATTSIC